MNQAEAYINTPDVLLALAGDGSWSQRRDAKHAVYSLVDILKNTVLYQVVLAKDRTKLLASGKEVYVVKGNYRGTSKGMEAEEFRRAIDWLDEKGLLPRLLVNVCDQDSALKAQFLKVFGENTRDEQYYTSKVAKWLMTAIKESERWARVVTRRKSNESDLEYEERLRKVMVEEFGRRMEHAKAHYFKAECDCGGPWQESHNIDLESMDCSAPITSLPPEILCKIASYLEGKEFGCFSSTCKFFLTVGRQQQRKTAKQQSAGANLRVWTWGLWGTIGSRRKWSTQHTPAEHHSPRRCRCVALPDGAIWGSADGKVDGRFCSPLATPSPRSRKNFHL
ncbi:hypothetical protein QOT17_025374 [Balamuthia mandrillaris]